MTQRQSPWVLCQSCQHKGRSQDGGPRAPLGRPAEAGQNTGSVSLGNPKITGKDGFQEMKEDGERAGSAGRAPRLGCRAEPSKEEREGGGCADQGRFSKAVEFLRPKSAVLSH